MLNPRKNLITLLLLLLVYGWFFVTNNLNRHNAQSILGANSNIVLFTQPESGEKPIVDAIDNAKMEVLVEVYLLSDKEVMQSLIDAKQRGLDVRIILEQHPFGGRGVNNSTKKILEEFGILVKWSNPKYSLTHEKAIIIDKKALFVLNQNLTTSSFDKNREYNILDVNTEEVLLARDIFIADWERKDISIAKSNLIESPNTSRQAIYALISNAQTSIDIEMEVVEDNEIIDLLSQKAKNTTVRILAPPASEIKSNGKGLLKLKNEGVLVKTITSPYMHAKLIISDKSKAYIGSINLSSQSMDSNRELGIILSERSSLETLVEKFNSDWERGMDF